MCPHGGMDIFWNYTIIHTVSVKCRLWTADCGPGVKCRLSVKCRLQTESKMQAG